MSTETLQPRARQLPCSRASLGSHAPSPPAGERTRPTGDLDLGSPRCSREGQPPWRSVKQALPRALSVLSLGWVRARCSPQFWLSSLPWKVDDHLGGGAGGGDRIFGQKKKHNVLEGLTFRTSSTFPSAIYILRIVSLEISTHRQGRDPMNQVAGGTESRFAELSKLKKKKKKISRDETSRDSQQEMSKIFRQKNTHLRLRRKINVDSNAHLKRWKSNVLDENK